MTLRTKKRWKSIIPLRLTEKTARSFGLFSKVKSDTDGDKCTPVYINVYDLTPVNGYFYWAGLGIFHSGVEVHGVEYAFGAHDFSSSGVFEVEPRRCPGFKFRKSIFIGTTSLNSAQVREFMEQQAANYNGDTYHLIIKNCNHFCGDISYKLTGKKIPRWVNRLAGVGYMFSCCLPESLKVSSGQPDPRTLECEKRRLSSSFSCLSSISYSQKQMSASSLLIRSPLKGCRELKRCANSSPKEER